MMTDIATTRLFDSYGNPWLINGEPVIVDQMPVCMTIGLPHMCEGHLRCLIFDRILVEFGEAWYRVRGCE